MQNRFVGDFGDFGKFGLLRYLCGLDDAPCNEQTLNLAVVWYLTIPNAVDLQQSQGNRIAYLNVSNFNDASYRDLNPRLYDSIQRMVGASLLGRIRRHVDLIDDYLLLPRGTRYHNAVLQQGNRNEWFLQAQLIGFNPDVDLVYLDPDIGMQTATQLTIRHVLFPELTHFVNHNKSVVVYQDFSHQGEMVRNARIQHLANITGRPVWALRWENLRCFLVIPNEEHLDLIHQRVQGIVDAWNPLFQFL